MAIYSPVITCYEEFATPSESYNLEGMEMTVGLRCAWNDRHLLVQDLLTNGRDWPHGGFGNPPQASSATIVPWESAGSVSGQSIVYDHALVTVGYNHISVDLASEELEPTAEFITLDHRRFRWGSGSGDPLSQAESPGKLRRGLTMARTLYRVQSPLSPQLLTAIGGVNNAPYTSTLLGFTFATQTLLFTPPRLSLSIRTDGSDGYTVSMKFMYKPETWNSYWRSKSQSYEDIHIVGGGKYLNHPLVAMGDLLP